MVLQQDQIHCITLAQEINMNKRFTKLGQSLSLTILIEISQPSDLVEFHYILTQIRLYIASLSTVILTILVSKEYKTF